MLRRRFRGRYVRATATCLCESKATDHSNVASPFEAVGVATRQRLASKRGAGRLSQLALGGVAAELDLHNDGGQRRLVRGVGLADDVWP